MNIKLFLFILFLYNNTINSMGHCGDSDPQGHTVRVAHRHHDPMAPNSTVDIKPEHYSGHFYGVYRLLPLPSNLDAAITEMGSFNLQRDPWFGFAMQFNRILDEIVKNQDHSSLNKLQSIIGHVYSDPYITISYRLSGDQALSSLSFRRFSSWSDILDAL